MMKINVLLNFKGDDDFSRKFRFAGSELLYSEFFFIYTINYVTFIHFLRNFEGYLQMNLK